VDHSLNLTGKLWLKFVKPPTVPLVPFPTAFQQSPVKYFEGPSSPPTPKDLNRIENHIFATVQEKKILRGSGLKELKDGRSQ